LQERKFDHRHETGTSIVEAELATMKLHHACNQAEAQAVSGLGTAVIKSDETLHHAFAVGRRYAGSLVRNPDHGIASFPRSGHHDGNLFVVAARSVLHGIVDDIAETLGQKLAVGAHWQRSRCHTTERAACLLHQRLIELGDFTQNLRNIRADKALAGIAGLGAGNGKKSIKRIEPLRSAASALARMRVKGVFKS
jgi:hypothetical protein